MPLFDYLSMPLPASSPPPARTRHPGGPRRAFLSLAACLCLVAAWMPAAAQSPSAPPEPAQRASPADTTAPRLKAMLPAPQQPEPHPGQTATPRGNAEAYFTNLPANAQIETPYLLRFGLSGGWGLAPIAKPISGKSGHHHLLVNRDLPMNFREALPFNDQYIHFGKGQMETVLNLPPGTYSLRLLLADDQHLPHFVYSKPLKVTITRRNDAVDPKTLQRREAMILEPKPGAEVQAPMRVQFHAGATAIAHQAQREPDTAHFRLTVTPQGGGKPAELAFPNGQTETWLSPPPGNYGLRLDLIDNTDPQRVLASTSSSVRVR